jgi:2-phosphosulfolactate phosphatase
MADEASLLERRWFSQDGHRCRLDRGRRGAEAAAARGDVLVVVDTLSFSSAVATAARHGVVVYPSAVEDVHLLAERLGAEVAVKRGEVPSRGRFSLSPLTFLGVEAGVKVVLYAPNGATCCVLADRCPRVVIGCPLNARVVGRFVTDLVAHTGLAVTVLACGERWLTPAHDENRREAVEDYLGAGAVLSNLELDKSPEARVCEAAFRAVRHDFEEILWNCGSGIELRDKGYADDVRHAARLDLYDVVPVVSPEGSIVPG